MLWTMGIIIWKRGFFFKPFAAILFHRLFRVHVAVPVRKAVAKIKVGMVI